MAQSGSPNDTVYAVGDAEASRYRLEVQTRLFGDYVRQSAREFCGDAVSSILDLGCGEGQLGFVLREIYPDAKLVGIDVDARSIAGAERRSAELGLTNCEFLVGNVEQELPQGPFDLIYSSLVLSYTRNPEAVVRAAYERLRPGGHLWVKDFTPLMLRDPAAKTFYGGKFARMSGLIRDLVIQRGAQLDFMAQLPDWLANLGATAITTHKEEYICGGNSEVGRIMLSINIGSFYNLIVPISRTTGISEHELMQLYADIVNEAMTSKDEIKNALLNTVAQKPI